MTADRAEISQLIQRSGMCRDQGRWDELSDTFTADGTIFVTWFSGSFKDFVTTSRRMYAPQSPRVKHLIGVPVIQLQGDRALTETNVQILGRFAAEGINIDYTSHARFLDRLVRREAGWHIQARTAIYEKDRFDLVTPGDDFARFMIKTDFSGIPEPYRYLGYRLISAGRPLQDGIICDGSPDADALMMDARRWLTQP
jgi:hypothetical protein